VYYAFLGMNLRKNYQHYSLAISTRWVEFLYSFELCHQSHLDFVTLSATCATDGWLYTVNVNVDRTIKRRTG